MSNKNHIPFGVVTALILFVMGLVLYFAKLNTESWTSWLTIIILAGGVILSCLDFAKKNPGQTFGSIFANGFKTTAVITVISIVLTFVMLLIFPDMKEQAFEIARKKMEADGKMTEDQIQTAIQLTQKMYYVFLIGGILFTYMIVGVIASLIGAGAAPKGQKA
ncbi:uncharacterized protein DUF4199 [Chitinophaga dinghuensis]|uniref:Uncharacterized protein DUF4199 n=1 Tax=Chitinophaga dinghuensis TaxID=1539050 RepID=A0A327VYS4_9BACT|nr:DUF4199 domain-containing protein [Chitinophaga dinghuensis]RAJ82177.1 uncharacterized protein DUF4199 [Chitinophaga dinghuensis]